MSKLISNADAVDQWCEATRRLRGDVPLSEVCGFASRIESLVRKRLAERLTAYRDELELGKRDCCDRTAGVVIKECCSIVKGAPR